jgi:hypothetical protein
MYCNVCGKDDRFHKATLWSVFTKDGRTYTQASTLAFPKCTAIRFFQTHLIHGGYTLRKIKVTG